MNAATVVTGECVKWNLHDRVFISKLVNDCGPTGERSGAFEVKAPLDETGKYPPPPGTETTAGPAPSSLLAIQCRWMAEPELKQL